MRRRIVLIEPDALLGELYRRSLAERFDVVVATRAQAAIDHIDEHGADIVITDLLVGPNDGVELIHELRSYDDWAQIPIIILSSVPERVSPITMWQRYNVSSFLYKPQTSPRQLLRAATAAV